MIINMNIPPPSPPGQQGRSATPCQKLDHGTILDPITEALSEWIYEPSLDHLPVPGAADVVKSLQ